MAGNKSLSEKKKLLNAMRGSFDRGMSKLSELKRRYNVNCGVNSARKERSSSLPSLSVSLDDVVDVEECNKLTHEMAHKMLVVVDELRRYKQLLSEMDHDKRLEIADIKNSTFYNFYKTVPIIPTISASSIGESFTFKRKLSFLLNLPQYRIGFLIIEIGIGNRLHVPAQLNESILISHTVSGASALLVTMSLSITLRSFDYLFQKPTYNSTR